MAHSQLKKKQCSEPSIIVDDSEKESFHDFGVERFGSNVSEKERVKNTNRFVSLS